MNSANECIEFPNCSEVDETGEKCIKCSYDFYQPNEEGRCVIDFCQDYDESGKWKKCQKYFYLNEDKESLYINIPFCRKIDEEGKCLSWAGFIEYDEDINKAKELYETGCERWKQWL